MFNSLFFFYYFCCDQLNLWNCGLTLVFLHSIPIRFSLWLQCLSNQMQVMTLTKTHYLRFIARVKKIITVKTIRCVLWVRLAVTFCCQLSHVPVFFIFIVCWQDMSHAFPCAREPWGLFTSCLLLANHFETLRFTFHMATQLHNECPSLIMDYRLDLFLKPTGVTPEIQHILLNVDLMKCIF